MSDKREKELHALQAVLDTAVDGFNGYTMAVEKCTDASPLLRKYLENSQRDCKVAVEELRTLLSSRGETANDDGTAAGALHRGWIATRTALSSDDEATFLDEVVRGEKHAVEVYEDALEKIADPALRKPLQKQLSGLRENLTKAKAFDIALDRP